MSPILLEVIFIVVLLIFNGVFALAEAALISARKPRLQQRAADGDSQAAAALRLANAPGNFLATVQIGITLVGILAGAFGGATIAHQLDLALDTIPFLEPYSEALSLAFVVLAITYLSLIVGELVPKNIALSDPERFASYVARPMLILSKFTAPVVKVLTLSTNAALALLRIKPSDEPAITEEEIKVMIAQGAQMGTFHPAESQMVEQVFRIGDLRVGAIMTPRTELVWLDINEPQESIQQKIVTTGYSRYPVADGKLDNVIGMVRTKEVLVHCLTDSPFNLQGCLRPPLFVPETMALLCALEKMRSTGVHTALVIDEYGGLMGMITLNTLLQEIIRNDLEPSQLAESLIVRREDGSWLMDGLLPTDRFKATLKVDTLPLEDTGAYKYAWRICHDAN